MSLHSAVPAADLHVAGYRQATDPGAIGADRLWIDTSGGTGNWVLKIRNAANSGWETAAGGASTPLASSTVSGKVKTDTNDADPTVYLASSVDTLLGAKEDIGELTETGGPTVLTVGTISDGQYLKRSGSSVIGVAAPSAYEWGGNEVFDYAGSNSSSSSILTKGILVEPVSTITVNAVAVMTQAASSETLTVRIYELTGTTQTGAAVATASATQAGPGGSNGSILHFKFSSPVTLTAGHRYAVVVSNTAGGAVRVTVHNGVRVGVDKRYGLNGYTSINDANPANGATWSVTTASAPYALAVHYSE